MVSFEPWYQGSWDQHGAHLGPTGPRWVPCWPHELCYLGGCRQTLKQGFANILNLKLNDGDFTWMSWRFTSNHQRLGCLSISSFWQTTKEIFKLHTHTGPVMWKHFHVNGVILRKLKCKWKKWAYANICQIVFIFDVDGHQGFSKCNIIIYLEVRILRQNTTSELDGTTSDTYPLDEYRVIPIRSSGLCHSNRAAFELRFCLARN